LVDLVPGLVFSPLLSHGLEILASSLGHLWCSTPFDIFFCFGKICGFGLDLKASPFVFYAIVVAFSTTIQLIEG
jgi:hypothetical protein